MIRGNQGTSAPHRDGSGETAIDAGSQTQIDRLAAQVAWLDQDGTIVAVNASWRRFAADNGGDDDRRHGLGVNYVALCEGCRGSGAADARWVARAIRDMLSGRRSVIYYEYPVATPTGEQRFSLSITPICGASRARLQIAHTRLR